MFRLILWSKDHETYERIEHVHQLCKAYEKRTPVYYVHTEDGSTLTIPCSRYIIERIESEG